MEQKKSAVPGLTRGLHLLELIGSKSNMGFNEIKEEMDLHATTLNRLLKVLVEEQYLMKDNDNRYTLGLKLYMLGHGGGYWQQLEQQLRSGMISLNEKYGVSLLLVALENDEATVVSKVLEPNNLGMLEVGTVRKDLVNYPWGILYIANQSEEKSHELITFSNSKRYNNFNIISDDELQCLVNEAKDSHMVDDRGLFFRGRRFAVPIRLRNGSLKGALCSGTFQGHLTEEECKHLITDMKEVIKSI